MKEDKDVKGSKGSAIGKVRKLQKQYNKILVDLFDQFAAESIEEALEKNEGSFGENIGDIVQCALDCLKTKVMDELGVKSDTAIVAIDGIGLDLGTASDGGTGEGDDEQPGMPVPFESEEEEEEEEEEDEKVEESHGSKSILQDIIQQVYDASDLETAKKIAIDRITTSKIPEMQKRKMLFNINDINNLTKLQIYLTNSMFSKMGMGTTPKLDDGFGESVKRDKVVSSSRRGDQVAITEAYTNMYKK